MRPIFSKLLFSLFCLILLESCASGRSQEDSRPTSIYSRKKVGVKTAIGPLPLLNPRRMQPPLIVIDPGHGGKDPGARSPTKPPYQEKNLALSTAYLVKSSLEQLGYQTCMTRTEDVFVELKERAEWANEKNPVVFISIHYNSAPNRTAEGVEVYFYQSLDNPTRTQESRQLAQLILNKVVEKTQAKRRSASHGNFAVIRETQMPAVLVECGFVTNEREMQRIKDPSYVKKLAWGIALGTHTYLQKQKK
jgi:N-acetylmuramoyl-L-alanine amidase